MSKRLDDATKLLRDALEAMSPDSAAAAAITEFLDDPVDPTIDTVEAPMTIEDQLRRRAAIADAIDAAEAAVSKQKKELRNLDVILIEKYKMEGITSARISGLGTFTAIRRPSASILPEKKSELMELMKKHYPDLVKETINGNTLSAFYARSVKDGIKIEPEVEACLRTGSIEYLQWR